MRHLLLKIVTVISRDIVSFLNIHPVGLLVWSRVATVNVFLRPIRKLCSSFICALAIGIGWLSITWPDCRTGPKLNLAMLSP